MTPSRKHIKNQVKTLIQYNDLESCKVDYVSSNVKSSQFGAMLYMFEFYEAVIKMISKGRSPTMRHVSRTHRVALDWLFDRINLDPKIQSKYIDTKNQLADILTEGNFTRDEWNKSSPSVQYQHFQLSKLPRNDVEKDATRNRRGENRGKVEADVELGLAFCGKLCHGAEFECIKSPGDTQSTQSAKFESHSTMYRETCRWRFKSKMTQRQVLKCGCQMQKRTTVRGNSLLQERTRL